jgi:hypothetical protein
VGCTSPAAEGVIISPGIASSLDSRKVSQASIPVRLEEKVTKGGVGIGQLDGVPLSQDEQQATVSNCDAERAVTREAERPQSHVSHLRERGQ